MKAKIKHLKIYRTIESGALHHIQCHPEEVWECKIDDYMVILSKNDTAFKIPMEEYKNEWIEI